MRLSLVDVSELSREHMESISFSYLSRAELGEYVPPVGKLVTLARIYGVPLQELVDCVVLDRELAEIEALGTPPPGATPPTRELATAVRVEIALGQLERSVFVTDLRGTGRLDVTDELEVRIRLAEALIDLGLVALARRQLEAALGLPLPSGLFEARLLRELARCQLATGTARVAAALGLAAARALEAVAVGPPSIVTASRLQELRGVVHMDLDEPETAAELFAASVWGWTELGRERRALRASSRLAAARVAGGRDAEGWELHATAIGRAARDGIPDLHCTARIDYAISLARVGRAEAARAELQDTVRVAVRHGLDGESFAAHYHLWRESAEDGRAGSERAHLRALLNLRPRLRAGLDEVRRFDREFGRFRRVLAERHVAGREGDG